MDILVISILLFVTLGSYIYIEIKYKKYKKEDIKSLKSGFEISREIMDTYDMNNVYITESRDILFSYYDPDRKVIRLVKGVFNDTSITSCAISAFSAAYAIEDKKKNKLLKFRTTFSQLATIILYLGYLFLAIGILFGHIKTILVGIALEYMVLLFYVFTYKIEKDSRQLALKELIANKIITKKEVNKIDDVIKAASLTYIASLVIPISRLFKLIIEFGKSDKN